jgi:hypothetical protein
VKRAKTRGPGRPAFAEGTARTAIFAIRLSEEERASLDAAAMRDSKMVTQWAREVLLAAATTGERSDAS